MAFARWDLAHLHEFTLPDGRTVRIYGMVSQVRARHEGASLDSDVFLIEEGLLPAEVSRAALVQSSGKKMSPRPVSIHAIRCPSTDVVRFSYRSSVTRQPPLNSPPLSVLGTAIMRSAVANLAGVPSIVFGLFGLGFFINFIGRNIDRATQPPGEVLWGQGSLLWAACTLALLTLPTVIVATEEALRTVPHDLREASLALGATQWETIRRVVLPSGKTIEVVYFEDHPASGAVAPAVRGRVERSPCPKAPRAGYEQRAWVTAPNQGAGAVVVFATTRTSRMRDGG